MTSAQIKKQVTRKLEAAGIHPDTFTAKKDGTVEVKRGYYYRHGQTSEKWAQRIQAALGSEFKVIDHRDDFRAWPKDSEFVAVVALA